MKKLLCIAMILTAIAFTACNEEVSKFNDTTKTEVINDSTDIQCPCGRNCENCNGECEKDREWRRDRDGQCNRDSVNCDRFNHRDRECRRDSANCDNPRNRDGRGKGNGKNK